MSLWVKVCGITREADVLDAAEAGANAIGLNLWPRSKRALDLESARELAACCPPGVVPVAVFVDPSAEEVREACAVTGIRWVQLHGDEPADLARDLAAEGLMVLKAMSVAAADGAERARRYPAARLLLDAGTPSQPGGTGRLADWELAREVALGRPVILAGGLTPDNVDEAVRAVEPLGVDVASGVEDSPGVKNAEAMASFVVRARLAARDSSR